MAAGKTKSIDEIDDIGEMFEAMAALDIPWKGLHTLQDMKDRVKTAIIDQSSKSPSWNAGQVRIWYSSFPFVICALHCLT